MFQNHLESGNLLNQIVKKEYQYQEDEGQLAVFRQMITQERNTSNNCFCKLPHN